MNNYFGNYSLSFEEGFGPDGSLHNAPPSEPFVSSFLPPETRDLHTPPPPLTQVMGTGDAQAFHEFENLKLPEGFLTYHDLENIVNPNGLETVGEDSYSLNDLIDIPSGNAAPHCVTEGPALPPDTYQDQPSISELGDASLYPKVETVADLEESSQSDPEPSEFGVVVNVDTDMRMELVSPIKQDWASLVSDVLGISNSTITSNSSNAVPCPVESSNSRKRVRADETEEEKKERLDREKKRSKVNRKKKKDEVEAFKATIARQGTEINRLRECLERQQNAGNGLQVKCHQLEEKNRHLTLQTELYQIRYGKL